MRSPSPENFLEKISEPKPPAGKAPGRSVPSTPAPSAPPPEKLKKPAKKQKPKRSTRAGKGADSVNTPAGKEYETKDEFVSAMTLRGFMEEQNKEITHFWDARSTFGDRPTFSFADQLWSAVREYFEWNETHPLWESKVVSFQGKSNIVPVKKMRAMTLTAMCNFLDVTEETWEGYRKNPDLMPVVVKTENILYDQKLQGGFADLLNANIAVRALKLKDHNEVSGPGGTPQLGSDVTSLELAKAVALVLAKGVNVLDMNAKDVTPDDRERHKEPGSDQEITEITEVTVEDIAETTSQDTEEHQTSHPDTGDQAGPETEPVTERPYPEDIGQAADERQDGSRSGDRSTGTPARQPRRKPADDGQYYGPGAQRKLDFLSGDDG